MAQEKIVGRQRIEEKSEGNLQVIHVLFRGILAPNG
jgi:hypothetical protein